MRRIIIGQIFLIICCIFYLAWWVRGYRPGTSVNRAGGFNAVLLCAAALFGIAGFILSLTLVLRVRNPGATLAAFFITLILLYGVLLLITRCLFQRVVTTELLLIPLWTVLEVLVIHILRSEGVSDCAGLYAVIAAAFVISMVLYVAYYRMDAFKAYYAAMVPLITEALSMIIVISVIAANRS